MNISRHRLSCLTWTLAAASSLAACVLDPKSTGELDAEDDAGTDDGGDTSMPDDGATSMAAGDTDAGEAGSDGSPPGDPPDAGCDDDECSTPVQSSWSSTIPSDDHMWACDAAVDAGGRVALAWHVDPTTAQPLGRSGINLYDPEGNLVDTDEQDGQIFGEIEFASDGTLRVRGATVLGGNEVREFVRALDGDLKATWSQSYTERTGSTQCGRGSRGIAVDASDAVVTYDYVCSESFCPQSFVRRHAPDGTLLWEQNPGGNPGGNLPPIGLGPDGAVFHGAVISWDDYDEVEVRKYSPDGDEQWMTLIPGEIDGLWGTADGGVLGWTVDFDAGQARALHRLGPDGTYAWVSEPPDTSTRGVVAPTADETGLFVVDNSGLQRVTPSFAVQWTAPITGIGLSGVSVATARGDDRFAFAGSTDDGVFVTLLGTP